MKIWLCLGLVTSLAWARPGMSLSEARALSQQNQTYRQVCQPPRDHVFEQWWLGPKHFVLSDLHSEAGGTWRTERLAGQALFRWPTGVSGRVLQVQLDATFIQGDMRFFTANQNGQPLEEILTYHVPSWEQGCEHPVTHQLRVTWSQALLISLTPHSKMRLRRLLVQALN